MTQFTATPEAAVRLLPWIFAAFVLFLLLALIALARNARR